MKLVVVKMCTRHYTFTAAGSSEDEAKKALLAGWRRHLRVIIKSYGDAGEDVSGPKDGLKMSLEQLNEVYGIDVDTFEPGVCLRDGDRI